MHPCYLKEVDAKRWVPAGGNLVVYIAGQGCVTLLSFIASPYIVSGDCQSTVMSI